MTETYASLTARLVAMSYTVPDSPAGGGNSIRNVLLLSLS